MRDSSEGREKGPEMANPVSGPERVAATRRRFMTPLRMSPSLSPAVSRGPPEPGHPQAGAARMKTAAAQILLMAIQSALEWGCLTLRGWEWGSVSARQTPKESELRWGIPT